MSKEKKDMLKSILANTELIMEHLKINRADKTNATPKTIAKKPASKKITSKKPVLNKNAKMK